MDQITRNLETAFLLTNHTNSEWNDWDYRYIFLCPRRLYNHKARFYSYRFEEMKGQPINVLRRYKEADGSNINEQMQQQFNNFTNSIPSRMQLIFWDEIHEAYTKASKHYLSQYLGRIGRLDNEQLLLATRRRFKIAGIPVN